MTQPENLRSLLEAVANGKITPETAFDSLKDLAYQSVGEFAKIDHHRQLRTGFPEVIWGPGKTPEQIAQIMEVMRHRTSVVMATRIEPQVYSALQKKVRGIQYYEQAAVTAELSGFSVQRLWDVGVAGIHRLLSNRHLLESASVLIVVAGMEGALPSVVAGLTDSPVIAVPTSIGYGASFSGLAPLLTMLNSCAAGIGVVNIDNGFGAAVLAGQILRTSEKLRLSAEI